MKRLITLLLISVACATTHPPVVKSMAEYTARRCRSRQAAGRDHRHSARRPLRDHRQLHASDAVSGCKGFLRRPAAIALHDVERELAREGLGLKLFDGYRPYRVTVRMWKPIRNPDFVADPAKGHVTIAARGRSDADRSAHGSRVADADGIRRVHAEGAAGLQRFARRGDRHRAKLRDVMTRHGFDPLPSEWWHFDFRGWERFELLDLPSENWALGANF